LEERIEEKKEDILKEEEASEALYLYQQQLEQEEKDRIKTYQLSLAKEIELQDISANEIMNKLLKQQETRKTSLELDYELKKKSVALALEREISSIQENLKTEEDALLEEKRSLEQMYKSFQEEMAEKKTNFKQEVKVLEKDNELARKQWDIEFNDLVQGYKDKLEHLESKKSGMTILSEENIAGMKREFELRFLELEREKEISTTEISMLEKQLFVQQEKSEQLVSSLRLDQERKEKENKQEVEYYTQVLEGLQAKHQVMEQFKQGEINKHNQLLAELVAQQETIESERQMILNNREIDFEEKQKTIEASFDLKIQEFVAKEEQDIKVLETQNANILARYKVDVEKHKQDLQQEVVLKKEEYDGLKLSFENELSALEVELQERIEQLKVQETSNEQERLLKQEEENQKWNERFAILTADIEETVRMGDEQNDKLKNEYMAKLKSIESEKEELGTKLIEAKEAVQKMDLSLKTQRTEFEQHRLNLEQESSKAVNELNQAILLEEKVLSDVQQEINDEIQKLSLKRVAEEGKLKELINKKEEILSEEQTRISELMEKQQGVYDKLLAKKQQALANERKKQNAQLEKELSRLEALKIEQGEEFDLTMEELNTSFANQKVEYDRLLEEQRKRNDLYLKEYKEQQFIREQEKERKLHQLLLASRERETELKNQIEVVEIEKKEELTQSQKQYEELLLQANNEVEALRQRIEEQLAKEKGIQNLVEAGYGNSHHELLLAYERKVEERTATLSELAERRMSLHQQREEKILEENEKLARMIKDANDELTELDEAILGEQRRLEEFELDLSEKRIAQKEAEIEEKNTFFKKLNFLKKQQEK
ncbi:MAG: hypothetical protein ACK5LZ_05515, partial [Anaerorhabdus sp.]